MKIELSEEVVFGEPGPNIVWTCTQQELCLVISLLERLVSEKIDIVLSKSMDIEMIGLSIVIVRSSRRGQILTKIKNGTIETNLKNSYWSDIRELLVPLTEGKGFQYIELDAENLEEDANWIVRVV